jgi:hypothetical protein
MLSVIDRTCRIASVMSLDDDGEILTDLAGSGSLADALRLVMANVLAAESITAAWATK